jgi:hypothetical protein
MPQPTIAATIFLCAITFASQADAGDVATAEALFREGRALMDMGDFVAACPKLAESHAQDPATGTLLALAVCQEGAGQTRRGERQSRIKVGQRLRLCGVAVGVCCTGRGNEGYSHS